MWCFGEGLGWWPWFGSFWMLIVGGGLIALIVWGISRLTRQNSHVTGNIHLETAKERYAKGEITKEEYDQYKKDLS
jgi:putative membrane protein